MKKEVSELQSTMIGLLKEHSSVFNIVVDTPEKFEVIGTIPTMQGKKKVEGIYFSTVLPKPKDVRFYFFPAYTHPEEIKADMPADVAKCLKGKTCFHIKKMDETLEANMKALIAKGVEIYKRDGLL